MPDEINFLDIFLFGKEYRVACAPNERDALLNAVAHVDTKMREISQKTKNGIGERIAVMVALNIAHEHLTLREKEPIANKITEADVESNLDAAKCRILKMKEQLEAVLEQKDTSVD
jgi:cell division protein ZapA